MNIEKAKRRFSSRKFHVFLLIFAAGTTALFTKHLKGGEYIALITMAAAIYKTAQQHEKRYVENDENQL